MKSGEPLRQRPSRSRGDCAHRAATSSAGGGADAVEVSMLTSASASNGWQARPMIKHRARRTQTLVLLSVSVLATHCSDDTSCPEGYSCIAEGGGGDGTGGEGSGGNGGDGGGGDSPPAECEPSEGETIGADCGVFVKAGAAGTGTQASPFGSVTEAVANLGGVSDPRSGRPRRGWRLAKCGRAGRRGVVRSEATVAVSAIGRRQ